MLSEKLFQKLTIIKKQYEDINQELISDSISKDINKMRKLLKRKSNIEDVVIKFNDYLLVLQDIKDLEDLLLTEKDVQFTHALKDELRASKGKLETIIEDLKILLIPKDANDTKNVIVEIRGAVGGEEGNIFAADLFRMYTKYADSQKWKIEVLNMSESPNGGFSIIVFMIKGKNVFANLKFESGGHRVQRIPKTEVKGRVHTSIATVAVLPEAKDVDIDIKVSDLRIDTYRSSGSGGQHVNTTDSAVRITHIPTNTVVTSQDGRSQHDNKDKAMISLRTKLYDLKIRQEEQKMSSIRKKAVGSGDRSDKIRTYNYPQNRVTDHRINFTLQKLDQVMEGNIKEIIIALIANNNKVILESYDE